MVNRPGMKRTLALCGLLTVTTSTAFVVTPPVVSQQTSLNVFSPLVAGSIAGAAGVGVSFPLDSLKTKQQVLSASESAGTISSSSSGSLTADGSLVASPPRPNTLLDLVWETWRLEGWNGFFGGVQTSMIGQAVIKSVAFAVNSHLLSQVSSTMDHQAALLTSAAGAGVVTSFLAVPCDRIKVLMQCKDGQCQCNDWDCLSNVIAQEGVRGLFLRGLGATLCNQVPAYTIYFSVYGALLAQTAESLGSTAPLVCGAVAGAACVCPGYPADVVKTLVQNTDGQSDTSISTWDCVKNLYETQGVAGFWDGLTPRVLRAAVNHAVTFATYEWIMQLP